MSGDARLRLSSASLSEKAVDPSGLLCFQCKYHDSEHKLRIQNLESQVFDLERRIDVMKSDAVATRCEFIAHIREAERRALAAETDGQRTVSSMSRDSRLRDARHALLARTLELQVSDLQRSLEERGTDAVTLSSDSHSQLQNTERAQDAQRGTKDQRVIQKMLAVASRIQSKTVDGPRSPPAPEHQSQHQCDGSAVWSALQRIREPQVAQASETPAPCGDFGPPVCPEKVRHYSFSPVRGIFFEGDTEGAELQQTARDVSREFRTGRPSTQEFRGREYSFLPADSVATSQSSQVEIPLLTRGTPRQNTVESVSTPTFSLVDSFFERPSG